jgi:hypothetical protein
MDLVTMTKAVHRGRHPAANVGFTARTELGGEDSNPLSS